MTIATVAVAITGAVAGVVAPVYAHPDNLAAPAGVVTLKATLTGTYVHAPAGGRGTAAITFAGNRVCWKFTFKGIGTPTQLAALERLEAFLCEWNMEASFVPHGVTGCKRSSSNPASLKIVLAGG